MVAHASLTPGLQVVARTLASGPAIATPRTASALALSARSVVDEPAALVLLPRLEAVEAASAQALPELDTSHAVLARITDEAASAVVDAAAEEEPAPAAAAAHLVDGVTEETVATDVATHAAEAVPPVQAQAEGAVAIGHDDELEPQSEAAAVAPGAFGMGVPARSTASTDAPEADAASGQDALDSGAQVGAALDDGASHGVETALEKPAVAVATQAASVGEVAVPAEPDAPPAATADVASHAAEGVAASDEPAAFAQALVLQDHGDEVSAGAEVLAPTDAPEAIEPVVGSSLDARGIAPDVVTEPAETLDVWPAVRSEASLGVEIAAGGVEAVFEPDLACDTTQAVGASENTTGEPARAEGALETFVPAHGADAIATADWPAAVVEPGGAGAQPPAHEEIDPALLALLEEIETAEETQVEAAPTGPVTRVADSTPTLEVPELLEVLDAIERGEVPAGDVGLTVMPEPPPAGDDVAVEFTIALGESLPSWDGASAPALDEGSRATPVVQPLAEVALPVEPIGVASSALVASELVTSESPSNPAEAEKQATGSSEAGSGERKRRRGRKSRGAARTPKPKVEVVRVVPGTRTGVPADARPVSVGPDGFAASSSLRSVPEVMPTVVSTALPGRPTPVAEGLAAGGGDAAALPVRGPIGSHADFGDEAPALRATPWAVPRSAPPVPAPVGVVPPSEAVVTPVRAEPSLRAIPAPPPATDLAPAPAPLVSEPSPAVPVEAVPSDAPSEAIDVVPARRRFDWRGVNWRRTAAAAVLLALVEGVAFAAAYWMVKPSDLGLLVVSTAVAGVEVVIDGKPSGTTPLTLELAPGRHSIELRSRGQTRVIPVEIAAGVQTTQFVKWPADRPLGTLRVTSTPPGARVILGGLVRGTTPLVIEELDAGTHEILVESDAGSVRETVRVRPDTLAEIDAAIFSGWLAVFAPVELRIFEQGRMIGTTLDGRILMPPGRHEVELVNAELGIRQTRTVEIRPGKVEALSLEAPNGTLTVDAPPGTEVVVDGTPAGVTPLQGLTLAVGTHQVELRHPQLGQRRVVVSIGAGRPARVSLLAPQ